MIDEQCNEVKNEKLLIGSQFVAVYRGHAPIYAGHCYRMFFDRDMMLHVTRLVHYITANNDPRPA